MMPASPPPTISSPPNHSMPENTPNNHHLHPLQCPRCNSSNTKFCYYNNYSLSQPRHFCKACKRYWTRGGTLRNVPVGGGCRKNKRHKRPSSSSSSANPKSTTTADNNLPQPPTNTNPLFYNNNNPADPTTLDFPFSGFRSTRVFGGGDNSINSGFDFQPQVNGLGLGFSSGLLGPFSSGHHDSSAFYGGASSGFASLLASTFQHPKFGGPGLMSYEEMGKDLKLEGDQNGLGNWSTDPNPNPSYYPDPASLLGAWFDPSSNSNMGSSVPSLI